MTAPTQDIVNFLRKFNDLTLKRLIIEARIAEIRYDWQIMEFETSMALTKVNTAMAQNIQDLKTMCACAVAGSERQYRNKLSQATSSAIEMQEHFYNIMQNELICVICAGELSTTVLLTCGHVFCMTCVMKWLEIKRECPVCRLNFEWFTKCPIIDRVVEKFVVYYPLNYSLKNTP